MGRGKDILTQEKYVIATDYMELVNPATKEAIFGAVSKVATAHGVNRSTVQKIVNEFQSQKSSGVLVPNLSRHKKGNVGRKRAYGELVINSIRDANKENLKKFKYSTTRGLQNTLQADYDLEKVALSTIHNILKRQKAKVKILRVKPKLTASHKLNRVKYIFNKIIVTDFSATFKDQMNTVVLDESWFYIQSINNKLLVFPGDEVPPCPTVQHKNNLKKVMFLSALARPRKLEDGTFFDGHIGIWPIVEKVPALRNSKRRKKGTLETKCLNVDGPVYNRLLTEPGGVLDAIRQKMPFMKGKRIFVQQDNAPPHVTEINMFEINCAGHEDPEFSITLVNQPAQSPDLNINDLGFFNSLKKRVDLLKAMAPDVDSFIALVMKEYDEYDYDTLDHIWGAQFENYRQILIVEGGNQYKNPHSGVRAKGCDLSVSMDLYNAVKTHLVESGVNLEEDICDEDEYVVVNDIPQEFLMDVDINN